MKNLFKILLIICYVVVLSQALKFQNPILNKHLTKQNHALDTTKCNSTHFQFYGKQYFLLETQMQQTFKIMNEKYSYFMGEKYLYFQPDSLNSYHIKKPKAVYTYKNENPNAVFTQNKVMNISGGHIEVSIQFQWQHYVNNTLTHEGTGSSFGTSNDINYQISFSTQYVMGLSNFNDPKFNEIKLIRLLNKDSSSSTQQQIFVITYMMSYTPRSIRSLLQEYLYILKSVVQQAYWNAYPAINKYDNYSWTNPYDKSDKLQINLVKSSPDLKAVQYSSNPGFYLFYTNSIQNFNDSACSQLIPQEPFDQYTYGAYQQFISLTFLKNLLTYGVKNKKFDTKLNRQNWGTKSFKFTGKELSLILSNIGQRFTLSSQVEGQCTPDIKTISILKASGSTFNVLMNYNCFVEIQKVRILEFSLNLVVEVEGNVKQNYIDFWVSKVFTTTIYNDSFGFTLLNKSSADFYVNQSLNIIYQKKLFGSGLKLSMNMKNPSMTVLDNAILIYDSIY